MTLNEFNLQSQLKETLSNNLMNSTRSYNKISNNMPTPQNRILLDTPCKVCGDNSSGKHYGIHTCDGCSGFFKRSIRKQKAYPCKSGDNSCPITRSCRNQCRSCRLKKCREMGMLEESVQQERGPRNSTSGSSARGTTPTTMRMHAREPVGGIGPLRGAGVGGRNSLDNCAISHTDPYPTSRLMLTAGNSISLPPATTATSTVAVAAAAAASSASLHMNPSELPHLAAAAYHHHLLSQLPQLQDPTSQYNEMLARYMVAHLAGHMTSNPYLLPWSTRG